MRRVALGVLLLLLVPVCSGGERNSGYKVSGDAIPAPLVQLDSDQTTPSPGEAVFVSREAGHCVLCHRVSRLNAPFQGDLGPELSDVGSRLTAGQIRYRLVDASQLNPNTIMPSYYRTDHLRQLPAEYRGKTLLSARQIEQLVVYLASLKDPMHGT